MMTPHSLCWLASVYVVAPCLVLAQSAPTSYQTEFLDVPSRTIDVGKPVGNTTRGQIMWKTDVGKFNNIANSSAVHLAFGNSPGSTAPAGIPQATQSITYDSYLRTASISEAVGSDAYVLNYTYGPDRQRSKSVLKKNGSVVETRIYCGAYEEQRLPGTTNKVHYISGPVGLCAMIVVANGVESIYYTYTDHLGSVTALTKKVGTMATVVARRSYDPWGRERNANTWNGAPATTPAWLYRGFTGHEHVQPFGLISPALGAVAVTRVESAKPPRLSLRRDSRSYRDERKVSTALGGTAISGRSRSTAPWSGLHMNARMYDPVNGRMLAPDNYLQAGMGTQVSIRCSCAG